MTSSSLSRLVGCAAVALLAGVACGGSSGIDLFSNADGGPGSAEAGTSSSGSSGATADGGGGGLEAGAGGTRPGGDTTSITCGASSCALATDVCCLTGGSGTSATFACVAGSTCPPPPGSTQGGDNPAVTLKCTGAANCGAGTVCCVTKTDTGGVVSACAASCNGDQAQLCDPTAATTGCSASLPCSSNNIREWRLPQTFATCGGKGD